MLRNKEILGLVCIVSLGVLSLFNPCYADTDDAFGARAVSYTRIGVSAEGYVFNDTGNLSYGEGISAIGSSSDLVPKPNNSTINQSISEDTSIQNETLVNAEISPEVGRASGMDELKTDDGIPVFALGFLLLGLSYIGWLNNFRSSNKHRISVC